MTKNLDHPVEYAKVMKGLGYGHAVYHPPIQAQLNVGAFGFFDKEGDWHKLGEVSPPLPTVELGRPFSADAISSIGVQQRTLGADASVDTHPLGKLNAHMEYTTEQEFAAVLLARPFLVKHLVADETFFVDWIKQNFSRLRKQHQDIDRYGLVVVFKTCSTPYCAIATFGGAMKSVSAGFSGGAYAPGTDAKLSASGSWHLESESGAWRSFGLWDPEGNAADSSQEESQTIWAAIQTGVESLFQLQKTTDNETTNDANTPDIPSDDDTDHLEQNVVIFISAFHAHKRHIIRDPKVSEMRASRGNQFFEVHDEVDIK